MFKLRHFEFWNSHLFHLPVYLYWFYLSFKARSPFFFSAANPGIETGGLIGESKYKILQKIDKRFLPRAIFYNEHPSLEKVMYEVSANQIAFPFVVKPDVGQGGWLIELIHNPDELKSFLSRIRMPFIVQEYVDEPVEVGLLYYRYPGQSTGVISSLAIKKLLTVTGDGIHTVKELMSAEPRAQNQLKRMERACKEALSEIPANGEILQLSFCGNHSYGTTFYNASHLIDDKLTRLFDSVCIPIDGFYFGRFDIRCRSIRELKNGKFSILELNGVGSEPLHIFDPRENLVNAYRAACHHWKVIYEISSQNRKTTTVMNFCEAIRTIRNVVRLQRLHNTRLTIGN